MAWSAVVHKGADPPTDKVSAPLPSFQLDSLSSSTDAGYIAVAVVDANALIAFESWARLLSLAFSSSSGQSTRFVTVKEVLEEVRDPVSRFHLATIPCSLDCMEPTDEAMERVVKFARQTGDVASLSDVDLKLLALTYMLEEQSYGSSHLRVQPPPICVSQVKHMRERDLPGWGNNVQNLEEWEQLSQEPDIAADEDSHILGLRDLSLNTSEQEKVESDKDDKFLIEQEAQVSVLQQETVDNSQSIVRSDHVEDASIAVKGDKEDNTLNLAPVSDNSGHAPADAICEEKEHENEHKFLNLEEQENVNGDGWQRAVSRSTRRKHEKRAARVSTNASIKGLAETECFEKNEEGETVPDGTQDILDEDKSDGDHQCISETYVVEENGVPSCRDTESEASWALCPISHSKVACITADFPMQNVLLQIGLRVVSPNGVQIQQIHRWALKCEACRNVTTDVRRIFCPKCGNGGTLYKVSITTGPNGVMHTGTRKRFNIRGTKYSLPLPKGGRQGVLENPILREDQLPKKLIYPKKKALNTDFSAPAEMFEIKTGRKEKTGPPVREALAIFSGKRNPNRPRSKLKG